MSAPAGAPGCSGEQRSSWWSCVDVVLVVVVVVVAAVVPAELLSVVVVVVVDVVGVEVVFGVVAIGVDVVAVAVVDVVGVEVEEAVAAPRSVVVAVSVDAAASVTASARRSDACAGPTNGTIASGRGAPQAATTIDSAAAARSGDPQRRGVRFDQHLDNDFGHDLNRHLEGDVAAHVARLEPTRRSYVRGGGLWSAR